MRAKCHQAASHTTAAAATTPTRPPPPSTIPTLQLSSSQTLVGSLLLHGENGFSLSLSEKFWIGLSLRANHFISHL